MERGWTTTASVVGANEDEGGAPRSLARMKSGPLANEGIKRLPKERPGTRDRFRENHSVASQLEDVGEQVEGWTRKGLPFGVVSLIAG